MDKVINEARDVSTLGNLNEEDVKPFPSMPINNREDNSPNNNPRALVTHLRQERCNETSPIEPTTNPCKRLYKDKKILSNVKKISIKYHIQKINQKIKILKVKETI